VLSAVIGGRRRGWSTYASPWSSDPGKTTLSDMATGLQNWLNFDSVFSQYYTCIAVGAVINIYDLNNRGGNVTVAVRSAGLTTYTASGFSSVLGVYGGRAYAFVYVDTTDSLVGNLSTPTDYSDIPGSCSSIVIGNIPVSSDTRVNYIDIYAFPDGTNSGNCYKLARIANTSPDGSGFTSYTDTQVESGLTGLSSYLGPTQPAQADDMVIKVNRDGSEWFEMHIPPNASQSNVVSTTALRGLSKGSLITVDAVNNIAACDLKLVAG
jgi:hypothetical protein